MTVDPMNPEPATDAYRQQQLALAVQTEVARGYRVESQGPFNAILRKGKPVNHILHLILTLVTLGFWVLVWVPLVFIGMSKRATVSVTVDQFGGLVRQKL